MHLGLLCSEPLISAPISATLRKPWRSEFPSSDHPSTPRSRGKIRLTPRSQKNVFPPELDPSLADFSRQTFGPVGDVLVHGTVFVNYPPQRLQKNVKIKIKKLASTNTGRIQSTCKKQVIEKINKNENIEKTNNKQTARE